MGRLSHYFKKFRIELRRRGLVGAVGEVFGFLFRRSLGIQFLVEAFEYHVLAKGRSIPATLLQRTVFGPLESDRILIYASFDSNSSIGNHVKEQLSFFCSQGYQVVFVSTSPVLSALQLELIEPFTAIALHRRNVGYDFASYRLGFDEIRSRVNQLKSLVVMNDSCYGPKFDFGPLLNQMQRDEKSVFGLTKSTEIAEHIQSYFYHFGADVNAAGITTQFFNRVRILFSKWGIVRYLEIGSSVALCQSGVQIKALVDSVQPEVAALLEINELTEPTREPLASRWIAEKRLPFIKRSAAIDQEIPG